MDRITFVAFFFGGKIIRLVWALYCPCHIFNFTVPFAPGGPYGMKFSSPEGGFPEPYGDGYGAHMVSMLMIS